MVKDPYGERPISTRRKYGKMAFSLNNQLFREKSFIQGTVCQVNRIDCTQKEYVGQLPDLERFSIMTIKISDEVSRISALVSPSLFASDISPVYKYISCVYK
jgi:hypothetical protein